ncbi:MAG: CDP-diacylglycerol--glycerol-3-phosphate 3-phosphatidyltransferase [Verrucomicrobiota bacterium]|jgi:CDP-diacylglycerol--glycerol-3-phosphate 3-phosphatidyltransferase
MNIANQVTCARFVFTIVFLILAQFQENDAVRWTAVVIGILTGCSDFVDGWLARKYNIITDFGKLMDPITDKIFVCCCFIVLVENKQLGAWAPVLILSREFAVSGLRQLASQKGIVIAADTGGKIKTILQCTCLAALGLHWGWRGAVPPPADWIGYSLNALVIVTVLFTIYTGYRYFSANRQLFMESK